MFVHVAVYASADAPRVSNTRTFEGTHGGAFFNVHTETCSVHTLLAPHHTPHTYTCTHHVLQTLTCSLFSSPVAWFFGFHLAEFDFQHFLKTCVSGQILLVYISEIFFLRRVQLELIFLLFVVIFNSKFFAWTFSEVKKTLTLCAHAHLHTQTHTHTPRDRTHANTCTCLRMFLVVCVRLCACVCVCLCEWLCLCECVCVFVCSVCGCGCLCLWLWVCVCVVLCFAELFVFVPSWLFHLCVFVCVWPDLYHIVGIHMFCSFVQRVFTLCVGFLSERDLHIRNLLSDGPNLFCEFGHDTSFSVACVCLPREVRSHICDLFVYLCVGVLDFV